MKNICKNKYNITNLPVPELESTMQMYKEWLAPITDEKQLEKTSTIIDDFMQSSQSTKLQNYLIEKSQDKDNSWIAEWWVKYAYLVSRGPVTPECNAGLDVEFDFEADISPIKKIAYYLHALAKVYIDYKNDPFSYVEVKANKVSLDQLNYAFSAIRLFGEEFDEYHFSTDYNNHVVLLFKNNVYSIKVIEDNKEVSVAKIYNALNEIINNAQALNVNANFVSAACNRAVGNEVYQKLLKDNSEELKLVNDSIAVISYDDIEINSFNESVDNTFCNQEFYNRWHGKGISTIFTNNTCTFIADHTYVDGGTEMFILENVNEYIKAAALTNEAEVANYEEINFTIDEQELKHLLDEFRTYLSNTAYSINEFSIDREKLKEKGILSLDGFVQIIFQYAHKQAFGKIVPTYESVDIRSFYRARTECLRPVSTQSVEVVNAIEAGREDLQELIIASTNEHYKRLKNCKNANGVNRHLFGLHQASKELGIDVELFNDKGYELISNNRVSTSSLTNRLIKYFYYQQVSEDGFGLSYQLGTDKSFIVSSSIKFTKEREEFIKAFNYGLEYIKKCLNI